METLNTIVNAAAGINLQYLMYFTMAIVALTISSFILTEGEHK